jgi:hypothetical protein
MFIKASPACRYFLHPFFIYILLKVRFFLLRTYFGFGGFTIVTGLATAAGEGQGGHINFYSGGFGFTGCSTSFQSGELLALQANKGGFVEE